MAENEGSAEKTGKLVLIAKRYWWISLCLVAIIGVGTGGYFYYQYQNAQKVLGNSSVSAKQEQQKLVTAVGKLMELPLTETPTVATVTDVNKLKGQPFFQNAQNGYKVLIYQKAKKAILYDPVRNKIVEVGPVNFAQTSPTPLVQPTPAIVRVAIYNGTKTVGLASAMEKELKNLLPNLLTVSKDNANGDTYTKSLVIDLTGKLATVAQQTASAIKGEVATLPKDETKPDDADLLIIVGTEK